jgi:hypothetical protein
MRAAVPLALALLLAACTSDEAESCPGAPVAQLTFEGQQAAAPLPEGLDPDPALTACAPAIGFPESLPFSGTLAADPGASTAALCREGRVFFGTRDGARWSVETSADGAVLSGCGSSCVARSRTVLRGDVGPDPEAPTTFAGALVEQLSLDPGRPAGECGGCELPCAGRYTLTGAVQATP